MGVLRGITIKLPESTLKRLAQRSRETGRSVAALVRERLDAPAEGGGTVYAITADLAGVVGGGRRSATNRRRRFRQS